MKFLYLISMGLILAGCAGGRIQPGRSQARIGDMTASAVQSENPQAATTQTIETETISRPSATPETALAPATTSEMASPDQKVVMGEIITRKKITTTIGASQKDLSQEITAKLSSVRWLQWLGVLVALFGIAALTWPPLRLIVASVTTGAACIAAGAAMVFLPLIIVGHEVLILGVASGLVALWFLAHRHGSLSGQLNVLKSKT